MEGREGEGGQNVTRLEKRGKGGKKGERGEGVFFLTLGLSRLTTHGPSWSPAQFVYCVFYLHFGGRKRDQLFVFGTCENVGGSLRGRFLRVWGGVGREGRGRIYLSP